MRRGSIVLAAMLAGGVAPAAAVLVVDPRAAAAEIRLPPGFNAEVYVTGQGFDPGTAPAQRGIPSTSTLAFDHAGALYLARTGRRYTAGEVEDVWPIYRIPPGGARLTPAIEARFLHGPPLPNPQVGAVRGEHELFVTTFDRERRVGVLYRLVDGRAELFAGGTPSRGAAPVLVQPEGVAVAGGNVFVADRDRGTVLRLDATGAVLDPRYVRLKRPRIVVADRDHLWVGADGEADTPWQRGPGEIWRIGPAGAPTLVLKGPVPAAVAIRPGGPPFVADRQGAQIFVLGADGSQAAFATFTYGDAPRTIGFAPDTAATRAAGIAGDLFVVTISRGAWPLNEVIRVTGPFERLGREGGAADR